LEIKFEKSISFSLTYTLVHFFFLISDYNSIFDDPPCSTTTPSFPMIPSLAFLYFTA